jgi:outer membrane protein TolC
MTTEAVRRIHVWGIAALAVFMSATIPGAAESTDMAAPLLSLEDAVQTALRYNHLLAGTAYVVEEAQEREAALRTNRLPKLQLDAYEFRWLDELDFTIPAGSLGTVPPIGALPPQDSTFSVSEDYAGVAMMSVSQPLTQQYRIGLGLEITRLDQQIAQEELRRQRQHVAAEVRTTYYQISATEQGILALRDTVRAVEELDSVTTRYHGEGMVLRSDALEVEARLALERQRLASAESDLATQQEHLNQLLGRDVLTPFRVARPSELAPPAAALGLEEARERALASRAEVRGASLLTARADTARRVAVSGWIPDLSLTASYARLMNFDTLPDSVTTVGLYMSWEPFDWGRKRHEAAERAHQTARAREGREETEQQIAVEVGQRWRELQDAAALLEAMRLEQDATAASLETDRNRYRENAAILRDVLRTEARLSTARRDFTNALADYWSAVARLERAIGNEN